MTDAQSPCSDCDAALLMQKHAALKQSWFMKDGVLVPKLPLLHCRGNQAMPASF